MHRYVSGIDFLIQPWARKQDMTLEVIMLGVVQFTDVTGFYIICFRLLLLGATKKQTCSAILRSSKIEKNNSPSAVLKDFQLASIHLCPIKLGDGILQITAGCELNHSALEQKQSLGPN